MFVHPHVTCADKRDDVFGCKPCQDLFHHILLDPSVVFDVFDHCLLLPNPPNSGFCDRGLTWVLPHAQVTSHLLL